MKTKILSILALLLTVTQGAWAAEAWTGSGSGTPGDPYVISNNTDYWAFVHNVNDGTFTTQYFKLNYSPHSIASSIGTAAHPFQGHFDGNGNTAGLSINTENSYVALFAYASGATIENLHVNGTVTTSNTYAAGLIANATNVTITNCRSSVTINSSYNGGGGHAGFVGLVAGTITIPGCLFDGTLATTNGTTLCSGFIGWSDATTTAITNSLCVPASVTSGMEGFDFVRPRYSPAVTNSYASESFNVSNRHGKILRSISAGTDVTSLGISGASAEYNVSGITAYAHGIKYNDVYYAGNGDEVSLALSHADKAGYAFNQYTVAGGGTLTAQTETSATLSMTDANQNINAQWTPTYTATFADGNDNEGWTIDPASDVEGATVTVSYSGENKVKSVTVQAKPICALSAVTSAHVGKVIGADGNVYSTVAQANTATTACGVIAYVGSAGEVHSAYAAHKGIAVSLDETLLAYSTVNEDLDSPTSNFATVLAWKNGELTTNAAVAKGTYPAFTWAAGHNTTPGRVSGASAWFLPSVGQWNLAVRGMTGSNTDLKEGSSNANSNMDRDKLNVVLNAAGASPLGVGNYMMATEYSTTEFWEYIYLGYFGHMGKSAAFAVRPIFTF